MRLKHDLRQELGVVVSQAHALSHALLALPTDEITMQEALDQLTPTECRQISEYLTTLAQRSYHIHQRALWLKVQLLQELP